MRDATSRECPREADVLEAVSMGRWPECGDAELAAHVATCATCADVAAVALVLQDDRRAASAAAPVPGSGLVWWRAEARARREAARLAARPITIVQTLAALCVAGALVALVAFASPWFADFLTGARGLAGAADAAATAAGLPITPWVIGFAVAAWLILAPLAVYFAVSED